MQNQEATECLGKAQTGKAEFMAESGQKRYSDVPRLKRGDCSLSRRGPDFLHPRPHIDGRIRDAPLP